MKDKQIRLLAWAVILSLLGAILFCNFYAHVRTRDNRPKTLYCWLRFGAEGQPRVLVRCERTAISVDANGNGEFEPNERFARARDCKDFDVLSADGETTYTITSVACYRVNAPPWAMLSIDADIRGPRQYHQLGWAEMAATPHAAPDIPFDGRLAISSPSEPVQLRKSAKSLDISCWVGTFHEESSALVRSHFGEESSFPSGVHPVVDIEFPPNRPGAAPVRKQYPLDGFC
jgi:hypothetical protein